MGQEDHGLKAMISGSFFPCRAGEAWKWPASSASSCVDTRMHKHTHPQGDRRTHRPAECARQALGTGRDTAPNTHAEMRTHLCRVGRRQLLPRVSKPLLLLQNQLLLLLLLFLLNKSLQPREEHNPVNSDFSGCHISQQASFIFQTLGINEVDVRPHLGQRVIA